MWNFLLGAVAGVVVTLLVGFIWAALVIAGRVDEINLVATDSHEDPELTELRQRLAASQIAAEEQRQRANYYYDLFCDGARANAQLRQNGVNHAA